ncbi:MAG: hypothetical protein CL521_00505 [Actinobacteria bacterium]|nr:hypothetical protein [Actinomycetota bacterium]
MIKQFSLLFWISIWMMALMGPAISDSLWDYSQGPFYGVSKRQIQIGDNITVYISESTAAVQEATTRTNKDSSLGSTLLSSWDQVANLLGNETIRKTFDFQLGGNDQYQGAGQTSRRSNVKAVLTAQVTEIYPNGNLYVMGDHKVKVNNEVETVRVSGIIRLADISAQNSVYSYQIAKAVVSVNGAGVVAAKQTPGLVTKMFNWLF